MLECAFVCAFAVPCFPTFRARQPMSKRPAGLVQTMVESCQPRPSWAALIVYFKIKKRAVYRGLPRLQDITTVAAYPY